MMNLFDIMQQAQNGQAMQNIARQYGLSQQQTQAAIEALLPAFSMGLQRQTQDPYAFGSLAQMMTAKPFAQDVRRQWRRHSRPCAGHGQ